MKNTALAAIIAFQCPPPLGDKHEVFKLYFDGIWFVEGVGDEPDYLMETFTTYEVIDSQLQVEGKWKVTNRIGNPLRRFNYRQCVIIPRPWKAKQGLDAVSGVCVEGHRAIVLHGGSAAIAEIEFNWCLDLLPAGDINEDGRVDSTDSGLLFADWGTNAQRSDINRDGSVNGDDLGLLYTQWTE